MTVGKRAYLWTLRRVVGALRRDNGQKGVLMGIKTWQWAQGRVNGHKDVTMCTRACQQAQRHSKFLKAFYRARICMIGQVDVSSSPLAKKVLEVRKIK